MARWLGLVWLGRHGSAVIAVGVFLGLAIPPLASVLKPLLVPAIVGPFLIALIRLDWRRLGDYLTRPAPTALALLWLLVLSPLLVHAVVRPLGLPAPVHGGLVLMAAAPPLMASGALAMMLRLDAALAVLVTTLASALMPFTLPPIALHLLGVQIDIALGELMLRLGLVVGGCFATALCLRRVLPRGFTRLHAEALDGLAVLGLLLFATAIMDGVTAMALERPRFVLLCALAVFVLNFALQVLGSAAFAWRGRRQALTLGLCSGNANLGLLLAALADRAAVELFVFVAVAQLPIYTLPVIQRPLYRRWLAGEPCLPVDHLVETWKRRSSPPMHGVQEVLDFWFHEDTRPHWFQPDPGFDQTVRQRFAGLLARAATGELKTWEMSAEGSLALCILLDQMSRNMFRGDPRAFATDDRALAIAEQALAKGYDRELTAEQKQFLYMPFMHSESLPNQLRALALFESQAMPLNRRYAEEHVALIRRFGRFPHRNAILGRPDTEAEAEYLSKAEQRYGRVAPRFAKQ